MVELREYQTYLRLPSNMLKNLNINKKLFTQIKFINLNRFGLLIVIPSLNPNYFNLVVLFYFIFSKINLHKIEKELII
jgi:hypothetical protein